MRRRKKILLRNILVVVAITGIIIGFYFMFFHKKANIKTANQVGNKSVNVEFETTTAPKVEIVLPEKIHDTNNTSTIENTTTIEKANNDSNSGTEKTYKPIQSVEEREFPKRYLETITTENEITILIGDDSQEFINQGSPIQIGVEYQVIGIEEPMLTTYIFNISNYNYPIFLLLSQTGHLYYIDTQKAYSTGVFKIAGKISDIPEVESVHETQVEENGRTYSTAVITCKNGEGYEFNLNMIGK